MTDQQVYLVVVGLLCAFGACIVIWPYYRRRKALRNWRKLVDRKDVLILHTQASGDTPRAEVLEIAVLDTTGVVRFHALSLPQGPIPRTASDIHGLTRAKLKEKKARPWPEINEELMAALKGAKRIVAYDAPTERQLLRQTVGRYGFLMPSKQWVDVREGYRILRPFGLNRLVDALRREGVKIPGKAHRAKYDCRCVLGVMREVVNTHRARGE